MRVSGSLFLSAVSTVLLTLGWRSAGAGVTPDLPYPDGQPSALEIMEQVYFVNHFYALRNFAITRKGRKITVLVSRTKGKRPTTNTLERYLNNDYKDDPVIRAKDLAIFRSGKLRGTGILITDYDDDKRSQSYVIWLPALRKTRRFAQPAHDDSWGGLDFTFGDVVLRKPEHETHENLGKEIFAECLSGMEIPKKHRNRYTRNLPKESCVSKGREVYKVKSTTKFK
ncbi:MAG TPA: outer membrane lipoprotein-sorting protein, partial [Chromatiaceae bacterium]|nr:outer membrane lipoprotein-sorting protein [Chromatiaceae bacterium]